jgi:FAD:protein FMN transferase
MNGGGPCCRSMPMMGTIVTIEAPYAGTDLSRIERRRQAISRAFEWFANVEASCSRFDPESELRQLSARVGRPVPVSDLLYQAVQFALALAERTSGAFDPAIGHVMEDRGFNREYSTGALIRSSVERDSHATFRDVRLDPGRKAITLQRSLVLDLGAVAKGMAVDLAARELQEFEDFSIDAGGDLYLGGCNASGEPWCIGIRHPRRDGEIIDVVRVSDLAVCTSGDYERRNPDGNREHHIMHPETGASPRETASVTVLGPNAMLADAVATAVFVLGPAQGIELLNDLELDGLIISPALERYETAGMKDYRIGSPAVL